MPTTSVKIGNLQSIKPGHHTLEAFHTATTSGTANTLTTETITLDKAYASIKCLSLAVGPISSTAGGLVQGCFVENTDAGVAAASSVKVSVRSSATSEAIGIRALLMVKETDA